MTAITDTKPGLCHGPNRTLLRNRTGEADREAVADLVGGLAVPVILAIKAIWMRKQADDVLVRKTIETQLEATS